MIVRKVKPNDLLDEVKKRKDERLIALSVIDDGKKFYLLYHFDGRSLEVLEVSIPKNLPLITSISHVFPSAELYEREAHDFFGIEFEGNYNLHKRLFLPDNWKGKPPLKKV